jgi:non-heme chloroperoxidase
VLLVGASLGGITSLTVAGEHPEMVAGLVLVDVVVKIAPQGRERIRAFMTDHPNGFGSLEEVADAIAAYNPNRPRPRSLDGAAQERPPRRGRTLALALGPGLHVDPRRAAAAGPRRAAGDSGGAERIVAPTLIVRGMRSDIVTDAGLEDMRRRVPAAKVVEVGAAGHMVAGDDNDVFAGALEQFLRTLD